MVAGEGALTPPRKASRGAAVAGVTSVSVGFGHRWGEAPLLPPLPLASSGHAGLMAPTAQGSSNRRGTEIGAPTWGLLFPG